MHRATRPMTLALLALLLSSFVFAQEDGTGDENLRLRVVRLLGAVDGLRDPASLWGSMPLAAAGILEEIVTDPDASGILRNAALTALGHFDDPLIGRTLMQVAGDPGQDAPRRGAAARALAVQGHESGIEFLETLLAGDDTARGIAVDALGHSRLPAAFGALEDALVDESDDNWKLRIHYARARWLRAAAGGHPTGIQAVSRPAPGATGGPVTLEARIPCHGKGADSYRVEFLTSQNLAPVAPPTRRVAADGALMLGCEAVCAADASSSWFVVQLTLVDETGVQLVGAHVVHVIRKP